MKNFPIKKILPTTLLILSLTALSGQALGNTNKHGNLTLTLTQAQARKKDGSKLKPNSSQTQHCIAKYLTSDTDSKVKVTYHIKITKEHNIQSATATLPNGEQLDLYPEGIEETYTFLGHHDSSVVIFTIKHDFSDPHISVKHAVDHQDYNCVIFSQTPKN